MTPRSTNMASCSDDSSRSVGDDAGLLGEVWRQFAEEDATMTAPPVLERRVLAAWEALQHPALQHPPHRSHRPRQLRLFWAVGAIAGALWLAFALQSHRVAINPTAPASSAGGAVTRDADQVHRWPQPTLTPDAVIRLTADPPLETETLQLVRVRMPRLALQAVGVVVSGPNAQGFVEVDVVLGEDGLPRDVRRVALIRE
jgi:hypothetical protein